MKIKDNDKEISIRDSITEIIPQGENNPISISTHVENENEKSINLSFKDTYLFDNILSDTLDIEKNNEKISINTKDSGSSGGTGGEIMGVTIYKSSGYSKGESNNYIRKANQNFKYGIITLLQYNNILFYPTLIKESYVNAFTIESYDYEKCVIYVECLQDFEMFFEYYQPDFRTISNPNEL